MGSFWPDRACPDINRAWIPASCLEFLAAGEVVWKEMVGQLVRKGVEKTDLRKGGHGVAEHNSMDCNFMDLGFQERSTTQSLLSLFDTLSCTCRCGQDRK